MNRSKKREKNPIVETDEDKEIVDLVGHADSSDDEDGDNVEKVSPQGLMKLLKYLNGTICHGLQLSSGTSDQLIVHVDSNWAGEPGSKWKSRTGLAIFYGNAAMHYYSSLQKRITLSSSEAEYFDISEATKIVIWLDRFYVNWIYHSSQQLYVKITRVQLNVCLWDKSTN